MTLYYNKKAYEQKIAKNEKNIKKKIAYYKRFSSFYLNQMTEPINSISIANSYLGDIRIIETNNVNQRVNKSIIKLRHIIKEIKDFFDSSGMSFNIMLDGFEPEELVKEAFDDNRELIIKDNVKTLINIDKELDKKIIRGDNNKLIQCLSILINNGIMYNTSATKIIKVECKLLEGDNSELQKCDDGMNFIETTKILKINVIDNGYGIHKQHHKYIFKSIDELSELNEINYIGMNLNMVKNIINYHGGTIEFQSTSDIGTCFTIKLPYFFKLNNRNMRVRSNIIKAPMSNNEIIEEFDDIESSDSDDSMASEDEMAPNSLLKILFVDDNAPFVEYIRMITKNWGYNIDVAFNGEEAIEKIKLKKYDLIFMDNWMPKKSGIQAAKEIKQIDEKIRIIGVTGINTESDIQNYHEVGVKEILPKPFAFDQFKKILFEA